MPSRGRPPPARVAQPASCSHSSSRSKIQSGLVTIPPITEEYTSTKYNPNSLLSVGHRDPDAALGGDLGRPVVARVGMPDHARARVVGQHPLQLLRGQLAAVGHPDLAALDPAPPPHAAPP